jgi:hypothetical protein
MPSPKWKLVVDIGEVEDATPSVSQASASAESIPDSKVDTESTAAQGQARGDSKTSRDNRIDLVVAILGKYMPSDPLSPLAPFVAGFMSLRLLLLRPSRTAEEQELVRTMLDSYSSYATGGREESDIAVMLARDFQFLSQQQQQQASLHSFLDAGANNMNQSETTGLASMGTTTGNSSGLSLFGQPSTRFSLENSPALTPIPAPGYIDNLSIVSN